VSLVVDAHREYLSDPVRVDAFARAIAATVQPGDVVVDLGAGTGILGLLACRAGAAHVYAIEADGMIEIARALARDNGVADRITFVPRHSSEVHLPQRADVLMADLIGRMGFEAGVFDTYRHASRWLKSEARVIPSTITIVVAPVEEPAAHRDATFWADPVAGFDFHAALDWSMNTGYPRTIDASSLLSGSHVAGTFDPTADARVLRLQGSVHVSRPGRLHGLAAWFSAQLARGVTMTNAPDAPTRIARRNVFFPLTDPVPVAPGDRIAIDLRIRPEDLLVSWHVEADTSAGRRVWKHSTLAGMLLVRDDLRTLDPDGTPRLTPRGEARRTVLLLCDGARPLREIEEAVFERHPSLFADRGAAAAFVAEVVSRYSVTA
jgi:protein arginine N-methyltransferase 1